MCPSVRIRETLKGRGRGGGVAGRKRDRDVEAGSQEGLPFTEVAILQKEQVWAGGMMCVRSLGDGVSPRKSGT